MSQKDVHQPTQIPSLTLRMPPSSPPPPVPPEPVPHEPAPSSWLPEPTPSGWSLEPQPSAWSDALDEASLMSPLASAAWGRSFSRAAASPRAEPGEAVCEGDGEGEGGWTMMSAEVGSLCRLALPISVTNLAGGRFFWQVAWPGAVGPQMLHLECLLLSLPPSDNSPQALPSAWSPCPWRGGWEHLSSLP